MQETEAPSLGREDPLEKGMSTHSSTRAWKIPWTEEPGTTDWFQIGKGVRQGRILSPCLFNLYAEYIMSNTGLDKAQAGIKISRGNINNFRQADETTLMAESEEEQKHGVEGKTRGLSIHPALNTSKGWAKHPSHASNPTPGPILTLTSDKEPAHSSPSGSCKGTCS